MSEYTDIEIVEVVSEPTVDGKMFSAKCKIKGKDEAVKIVGYAKSKEGADNTLCIVAGKTIKAEWKENFGNYFTVGEAKPRGGGGGGRTFTPRFSDTREGFMAHQRIIMAQSCLGHAVAFMQGLPADKAAEKYTAQAALQLASAFFHALWKDATDGLDKPEAKSDKQAEA